MKTSRTTALILPAFCPILDSALSSACLILTRTRKRSDCGVALAYSMIARNILSMRHCFVLSRYGSRDVRTASVSETYKMAISSVAP